MLRLIDRRKIYFYFVLTFVLLSIHNLNSITSINKYFKIKNIVIESNIEENLNKKISNSLNKFYNDNGKLLSEGIFKDGKLNGLYKYYYENGKLKTEGTFEDGIPHGPSKIYHENGKLESEGTIKYLEKDGLFKYYNENGRLELEETYKDGELIDSKEY